MISSLNLVHKTNLGKEEMKKVNTILQALLDSNDSVQFRQPVDWKYLQLTDYPLIIKNPMDLGTVKKKLMSGKYRYVQETLQDIQLIWDNCRLYNSASSWIANMSDKLERSFKKMVKNYMPNVPITVPGKGAIPAPPKAQVQQEPLFQQIPYSQKLKFTQKLKQLSQQQLGQIVENIRTGCPQALRQCEDERWQIIVDSIQPSIFANLQTQIQNYLKA